jgi:hypothetical protein
MCACHGSEQGGRPILRLAGDRFTPSQSGPRPQPRSVARCVSAWPVTWLAPHTRRARYVVYICTPLRLLACGWPRTLHPPPPVEYLARTPRSHPWLGAPGPRHAVAVHRPTHRRAARAGDLPKVHTAGARATVLVQPCCWQRLPPPCAIQCGVPPVAAALGHPAFWQRLPPPCAAQ